MAATAMLRSLALNFFLTEKCYEEFFLEFNLLDGEGTREEQAAPFCPRDPWTRPLTRGPLRLVRPYLQWPIRTTVLNCRRFPIGRYP
eukprot:g16413.t1